MKVRITINMARYDDLLKSSFLLLLKSRIGALCGLWHKYNAEKCNKHRRHSETYIHSSFDAL